MNTRISVYRVVRYSTQLIEHEGTRWRTFKFHSKDGNAPLEMTCFMDEGVEDIVHERLPPDGLPSDKLSEVPIG